MAERKSAQTQVERTDTEALEKEIAALKEDVRRLTQTLARLGGETLKASAEEMGEKIASQMPPQQREQLEALKEEGSRALAAIKSRQEDHPFVALLVAAGIGFLLGKTLGGRDR